MLTKGDGAVLHETHSVSRRCKINEINSNSSSRSSNRSSSHERRGRLGITAWWRIHQLEQSLGVARVLLLQHMRLQEGVDGHLRAGNVQTVTEKSVAKHPLTVAEDPDTNRRRKFPERLRRPTTNFI